MKIRNPRTGIYDYEINILTDAAVNEESSLLRKHQKEWAVEFIRFAGLEIDLKLRVAVSGRKNFRGVLQGLKSGSVDSPDARFSLLFEASDGSTAELEFSLAEVEKARLVPVIDFKGKKS